MIHQKIRLMHKILIAILLGLLGIGGWYLYQYYREQDGILLFNDERDTKDILDIFNRDRYWLVASPDYSPEFMLKNRAATQDMRYLGLLNIKVMRTQNALIGFVAYYMKTSTEGKLLFLAVNPQFRRKGFSEQLANHACKELKKMGATEVNLVTRTDNYRAQKLYIRLGFTEYKRKDGFIYYHKDA